MGRAPPVSNCYVLPQPSIQDPSIPAYYPDCLVPVYSLYHHRPAILGSRGISNSLSNQLHAENLSKTSLLLDVLYASIRTNIESTLFMGQLLPPWIPSMAKIKWADRSSPSDDQLYIYSTIEIPQAPENNDCSSD